MPVDATQFVDAPWTSLGHVRSSDTRQVRQSGVVRFNRPAVRPENVAEVVAYYRSDVRVAGVARLRYRRGGKRFAAWAGRAYDGRWGFETVVAHDLLQAVLGLPPADVAALAPLLPDELHAVVLLGGRGAG